MSITFIKNLKDSIKSKLKSLHSVKKMLLNVERKSYETFENGNVNDLLRRVKVQFLVRLKLDKNSQKIQIRLRSIWL